MNGAVGELLALINGYNYVGGNPVNGAVGELLGLINGYSYASANPVNRVDPSGMQDCIPEYNCSMPIPGDIFTPDLGNDFSTSIIPPNWGDFSPEDLRQLCNFLNSGVCSQGCIYIFPGDYSFILQSEEEKQKEEREKRKNAKGKECQGKNTDDPWRVQRYGDNSPRSDFGYGGWQAHHGVLNKWIQNLFDKYKNFISDAKNYVEDVAPAVLMPGANHRATVSFLTTLVNRGSFDVSTATWSDIQELARQLFDESETSNDCRNKYWDWFKQFAKSIICKVVVNGVIQGITYASLPVDIQRIWEFAYGDEPPSSEICGRIGEPFE